MINDESFVKCEIHGAYIKPLVYSFYYCPWCKENELQKELSFKNEFIKKIISRIESIVPYVLKTLPSPNRISVLDKVKIYRERSDSSYKQLQVLEVLAKEYKRATDETVNTEKT